MISALKFQLSAFWWALCALPLAWLWFVLINDLRVEWTVNPQYGYGWAVPFLCAYLLWKKAETQKTEKLKSDKQSLDVSAFQLSIFVLLALLYAPTRLILEADPGWRLVSWALALEVVGITLCVLRMAEDGGRRANAETLKTEMLKSSSGNQSCFSISAFQFSAFVFPVFFFLVAVPWPSGLETAVIQGLTRADAALTCELLGWLGIPAIPHGNVIEVATGQVGIDEACSGIRSFQATLMISLFLGELYRLSLGRRSVLCLAGFAMSFGFNLVRMSVLVWVAARQGVAAIAKWHDPTGVTILLACFFGLWGMGTALGKKPKAEIRKQKSKGGQHSTTTIQLSTPSGEEAHAETLKADEGRWRSEVRSQNPTLGPTSDLRPPSSSFGFSAFQFSAFALCLWLLTVEVSVAAWYGWHEARLPQAVAWSVAWPTNNPAFKASPLPARTREILRYDEAHSAAWTENGLAWQMVFIRWNPGRTALRLAQNHTPEACLSAAGHTLETVGDLHWLDVRGLHLPFQVYRITDTPVPVFVFYCLWNDRASAQGFETAGLTRDSRLAAVLAGRRNPGERSIEIGLGGVDNPVDAEIAVRAELEKMVR